MNRFILILAILNISNTLSQEGKMSFERLKAIKMTFITEKTLKGFYYKLPMLVVGTPRTLASLRELGFKTFPEFFNETYDEQICPNIRMGLIKNNIKDIMSKDLNYLHNLYWSDNVQAKLKHNREVFFDYVRKSSTNKYDSRLQEGFYEGYNSNFDRIYYDK